MLKIFSCEGEMHRFFTVISTWGYTSYYKYIDLDNDYETAWDEVYTKEIDYISKGARLYV
jgi:hypothetical protein